jgi:hypothetical protein
MIYVLVYSLLLYFASISFYSDSYKRKGYLAATTILILLAAFRYNTGTDFDTYLRIWNGISPFSFSFDLGYSYLEPGFVFFTSILKLIYSGDVIFFGVYAALTLGILTYALYKLELNVVAGLLIYFCFFYFVYAFNGMRQGLTMSIFVYSLVFLKKEEQKKYYFLNLLGVFFHYSSIIYLILGFLLFVNISKRHLVILVIMITLGGLVAYLTNAAELLTKFVFNRFMEGKVEGYFSSYKESTSLITFIPRVTLLLWIIFCTIRLSPDRMITGIVLFYSAGFAIYLSLLDFNYLNARINMLFRITDIVLALLFINKVKKPRNKLFIFLFFLIIYTTYFINNILTPENIYTLRSSF